MSQQSDRTKDFLANLRQKPQAQRHYGGAVSPASAKLTHLACPHCGAGRSPADGLTRCAYCGHEFMTVVLGDGLTITQQDNS